MFENLKDMMSNTSKQVSAVFGSNAPILTTLMSSKPVETGNGNASQDDILNLMNSKHDSLTKLVGELKEKTNSLEKEYGSVLKQFKDEANNLNNLQTLRDEYINLSDVLHNSPNDSSEELKAKISEIREQALSNVESSKLSYAPQSAVPATPYETASDGVESSEVTSSPGPEDAGMDDAGAHEGSDSGSDAGMDDAGAHEGSDSGSDAGIDDAGAQEGDGSTGSNAGAQEESADDASPQEPSDISEYKDAEDASNPQDDSAFASPENASQKGGTRRRRRYAYRRRSLKRT